MITETLKVSEKVFSIFITQTFLRMFIIFHSKHSFDNTVKHCCGYIKHIISQNHGKYIVPMDASEDQKQGCFIQF